MFTSITLLIPPRLFGLRVVITLLQEVAPNCDCFLCSPYSDAKGNVRVWDIHNSTHVAKRVWEYALPGKIRDISWAGDSQKIVIAGEGSNV